MSDTLVSPEIYTPPGCKPLSEIGDAQIRVGLQGPAFSGKTTAALTFPNPIILSIDRKVSAHSHRSDVILIPFHDVTFVDKIVKRDGLQAPPNRKDALIRWLSTEGIKLKSNQTLILDHSTGIEENFHIWFNFNENELASTKNGMIDSFVRWNMAKAYFEELHSCLKSVPANVIYICHETPKYDKEGKDTGKLRPLLAGQSGDKLGQNLTDFFRSIPIAKPKNPEAVKKFKEVWRLSDSTYEEWITSTDTAHETIYLWQTQADDVCDCGTNSLFNSPKYVIANHKTFLKYRKTKTT